MAPEGMPFYCGDLLEVAPPLCEARNDLYLVTDVIKTKEKMLVKVAPVAIPSGNIARSSVVFMDARSTSFWNSLVRVGKLKVHKL